MAKRRFFTTTPILTERDIIALAAQLRRPAAKRLLKGIGDDCAVVRGPGKSALLLTTDVLTDGVHFLSAVCPPESVGTKLLAVSLSDIAAMGGEPQDALVALMLPMETSSEWIERFYSGLGDLASRFGVNLVGGDVSRHPDRISLTLTLTGRMRRDEVLYRSGARPGDLLYVTGTLGDADTGLKILDRRREGGIGNISGVTADRDSLIQKYLCPEPRVEWGQLLTRTRTAHAAIDLSDGISVAARQMASASKVKMMIREAALPISEALKTFSSAEGFNPKRWVLDAGGDYELLFAVPPEATRRVERFHLSRPHLTPVVCIGEVLTGEPGSVVVEHSDGSTLPLTGGGWEHFRSGSQMPD